MIFTLYGVFFQSKPYGIIYIYIANPGQSKKINYFYGKKRKRNMVFSLVNGLRSELVMGLPLRCISRMRWATLCIQVRPICL